MNDNLIDENFTFDLSSRKMNELDLSMSSSVSHDYSYSFEIKNPEYLCQNYNKNIIENRKKPQKQKVAKEIR